MKGHTITITLEAGYGPRFKLDCGDGSECQRPVICGDCYRSVGDTEREPCEVCPTLDDECSLLSWFEGGEAPEFVSGTIGPLTFDVESWDEDGPAITLHGSGLKESTS